MADALVRFAVDTGGTFTDLVAETASGAIEIHKSPTTPDDPVRGVLDVLQVAADARGVDRAELLASRELFIHGTTRSVNAIITGNTARTALLATAGHRDMLLYREGGRSEPFEHLEYPAPYVPRELTFEIPERVGASGEVLLELDEDAVVEVLRHLRDGGVEAVAVCLLWSMVNPDHEQRIGRLIEQHLPGVPYTLSHELNPVIREYRRASSTAIDASLKPLMTTYLEGLESRLQEAGFGGRVLVVSSSGGMLDAAEMARTPIHSINSGPSMAPVAGRTYGARDVDARTVIVADTGGTTYDVSVVRDGVIPNTRETWLGERFTGHMTGFSSVDILSVGAGGGSIAWVDDFGMLGVGPESATSMPGPACYGRGGTRPTVTDACVVLGYVDPDYFLGGAFPLDAKAAADAIRAHVAGPLGLSVDEAAGAVMKVFTENMALAIEDVTLNQGIDPREAVLLAGGGAAGFNSDAVARRPGCSTVLLPETSATLSAAGALLSEVLGDEIVTHVSRLEAFDREPLERVRDELGRRSAAFAAKVGGARATVRTELSVEGRYVGQMWDIEVRLPADVLDRDDPAAVVRSAFDETHRQLFAFADEQSDVELTSWRLRTFISLREGDASGGEQLLGESRSIATRPAWFAGVGRVDAAVSTLRDLGLGDSLEGPAIVESPFTTIVVEPGSTIRRNEHGAVRIDVPVPAAAAAAANGGNR